MYDNLEQEATALSDHFAAEELKTILDAPVKLPRFGRRVERKRTPRKPRKMQVEVLGLEIRQTFLCKWKANARFKMRRWVRGNFGFWPSEKLLRVVTLRDVPKSERKPNTEPVLVIASFMNGGTLMQVSLNGAYKMPEMLGAVR